MIKYSYMLIDERGAFANDPSNFLDLVQSNGYTGIELNLTPGLLAQLDRLEPAIQASGLTVPSFLTGAAYTTGLCFASPDATVRQRTVKRLISYLDIAQRFDAILVVGLLQGLRHDEADPEIANERITACLRQVAVAAEAQKIDLVIEPVNHLQVGFNNSVSEVQQLIERIGSPAFKPMVDTVHMNIEETSLVQPIRDCGTNLRHVHLCESNGALLGSGHIDFGAVLRTLDEIDYNGFASIKVYRNASHEEAITTSLKYLQQQR